MWILASSLPRRTGCSSSFKASGVSGLPFSCGPSCQPTLRLGTPNRCCPSPSRLARFGALWQRQAWLRVMARGEIRASLPKSGKLAQASQGQKTLRTRVMAKKIRGKEQTVGRQRHEEAMTELQRRKHALNTKRVPGANNKNAGAPVAGGRASKGASAGVHTKNKHLQEFNNMKAGFSKRKGKQATVKEK